MNIHPKELANVAATAEAPRFDMYTGIHKALRALMADTLLAVGRMDVEDDLERAETTERVLGLLQFCAGHVEHENAFVHAAIEARAPGASAQVGHEHEEHGKHIARLADCVGVLRNCAPARRPAAAAHLYRELALFIAENFQHMHVEETAHNAVLWSRYTDAELVAVHDALLASIGPEEMAYTVRWLLPFMNPMERFMVCADMRGKAPAQVFDALLGIARPHMTGREWEKLQQALAA